MDKIKYVLTGVGVTCAVLAVVLLVIMAQHSPAPVDSPPPSVSARPTGGQKSPEREAAEQEIKAALAGHFAADDISITVSDETQTVSAVSPDLTAAMAAALQAQTAPDGWGDTVAALTELEATLPLLPDVKRNILYVKSEQGGDIYLNISGGKVNYNVIEPPDEGHTMGPGYMTLDIYNQITTGMTYQEVVNLVGAAGSLMSEVSLDGVERTAIYSWDGQGALGANANVTIQGEKVVSKAQFGLE